MLPLAVHIMQHFFVCNSASLVQSVQDAKCGALLPRSRKIEKCAKANAYWKMWGKSKLSSTITVKLLARLKTFSPRTACHSAKSTMTSGNKPSSQTLWHFPSFLNPLRIPWAAHKPHCLRKLPFRGLSTGQNGGTNSKAKNEEPKKKGDLIWSLSVCPVSVFLRSVDRLPPRAGSRWRPQSSKRRNETKRRKEDLLPKKKKRKTKTEKRFLWKKPKDFKILAKL